MDTLLVTVRNGGPLQTHTALIDTGRLSPAPTSLGPNKSLTFHEQEIQIEQTGLLTKALTPLRHCDGNVGKPLQPARSKGLEPLTF